MPLKKRLIYRDVLDGRDRLIGFIGSYPIDKQKGIPVWKKFFDLLYIKRAHDFNRLIRLFLVVNFSDARIQEMQLLETDGILAPGMHFHCRNA